MPFTSRDDHGRLKSGGFPDHNTQERKFPSIHAKFSGFGPNVQQALLKPTFGIEVEAIS